MSEWISVTDQVPTEGVFLWEDDVSGQRGIGCFDEVGHFSFFSFGGIKPWFFKDWSSITRWKPAKREERDEPVD